MYAIESVYLQMVVCKNLITKRAVLWAIRGVPLANSKLICGTFIAELDPSLGIGEAGTAEFLGRV